MLYTFLYIPIKKFQGLQKFKTPLIKNKVLIPQNQKRCKAFPPGKGDRPAPPTTKDKGLNCASASPRGRVGDRQGRRQSWGGGSAGGERLGEKKRTARQAGDLRPPPQQHLFLLREPCCVCPLCASHSKSQSRYYFI